LVTDIVLDPEIEGALKNAYGLTPKAQATPVPQTQPAREPQPMPRPAPAPEPDSQSPAISTGTGFAVCQSGYIVTACHVIEDADSIQVKFPGERWAPARVVKKSFSNDIAILKVDSVLLNVLALTDKIKLGQKIFTIGYPVPGLLGTEPKYADGSISSVAGIADEASLMQVSVPLQPGNSGGPLLNIKGQVVGMATSAAKIETFYENTGTLPQNINWAIKSPFIKVLLPQDCINVDGPGEKDPVELARNSVCLIKTETY